MGVTYVLPSSGQDVEKKINQKIEKAHKKGSIYNRHGHLQYADSLRKPGKRKARVDIGLLENEAEEVVKGNKETLKELKRYFASVFMLEDTTSIREIQEGQKAEVGIVAITNEKVLGKLKGLKVDKSSRPHGLHIRDQMEIAEEIVGALAVILQESLESGRVPEGWEIANVTPLFKKGEGQKM
eukprot:g35832.t1